MSNSFAGDSILVRPVMDPGVSQVSVYFPGEADVWFDRDTYQVFRHGTLNIPVSLSKVSLLTLPMCASC